MPKLLVGHSDITTLHLAISGIWPQVVSVHGPNIATRQLLGNGAECELNRRSLHDALFADDRVFVESLEFLRQGKASGPLLGGCLSLVTSAIGTEFPPRPSGKILFLEDTGEPPYRVDRMLTQLKNAGAFNQLRGVVFGVMNKCSDPYNDLKSVLQDVFDGSSFPIAFGLRSGHGSINLSIRLGAWTEMNSDAGVIRIGISDQVEG
jgi:muramoyltetrapeptide carboxypeptidase